MDGGVTAFPAYKSSVNIGERKTGDKKRNTLAFQFLDFIIIEPFEFTAQIRIVWVFHVSTISISLRNQVFDFPAEEDYFAYPASKLTGSARIPDKFLIVKSV